MRTMGKRYESIYRVGTVSEPQPNDYMEHSTAVGAPVQVITITDRRTPSGGYEQVAEADPTCPDCKGAIVWAEAGRVPGWRQCEDCGQDYITDMYGFVSPLHAVITCQGCGFGLPAGSKDRTSCTSCNKAEK